MPTPDSAGRDPMRVALLATPVTTASTLFGIHDILSGARRDWDALVRGQDSSSPFAPSVVSRDGQPIDAANGVRITPHASFAEGGDFDIVCITDLMVMPGDSLAAFAPEAEWVSAQYEAGATVASACSGALLLAHTGVLDGLDATTHWGYCEALRRSHPRTRWRPDQALVATGAGQRLIMAGSGTSWHALALFLIARFVGAEEAMQAARMNVLDWNATSPLAYAAMARTAQVDDAAIARCQEWVAGHYASDAPVAAMQQLSGLAERTFQRRFVQATGFSPLEYVHTLRLEEAKQLLEASEQPVEMVALEVGYQDAGFFTRLFRRKVGLSPAQYRRRFGALARRLSGVARTAVDAGVPEGSARLR